MVLQRYPYPQMWPQGQAHTDPNGRWLNGPWNLLNSFFQRTGGPSGIPLIVSSPAAAGSGQTNATALTQDLNNVTSGSGGVILMNLQPGQQQTVFNNSGSNLSVYPPSGGGINSLGTNSPDTLAPGVGTTYSVTGQNGSAATFSSQGGLNSNSFTWQSWSPTGAVGGGSVAINYAFYVPLGTVILVNISVTTTGGTGSSFFTVTPPPGYPASPAGNVTPLSYIDSANKTGTVSINNVNGIVVVPASGIVSNLSYWIGGVIQAQ